MSWVPPGCLAASHLSCPPLAAGPGDRQPPWTQIPSAAAYPLESGLGFLSVGGRGASSTVPGLWGLTVTLLAVLHTMVEVAKDVSLDRPERPELRSLAGPVHSGVGLEAHGCHALCLLEPGTTLLSRARASHPTVCSWRKSSSEAADGLHRCPCGWWGQHH